MTHTVVLLLALLIGVVAGLRALAAPAVLAWAALLDWIDVDGSWASWLDHPVTVTLLTVAALIELVADLLPMTPDRTTATQFAARIVAGAFAGAAIGTVYGYTFGGLGAGLVGAVLGTVGGYRARKGLVAGLGGNDGHDLPIALLEDSVAVLGGFAVAALAAVA